MKVLITRISNYLSDNTDVKDMMTAKSIKGFFFQNLPINVIDQKNLIPIIARKLAEFLSEMRPELMMVIESEYVDKVYRDSYYSYFSTKLKDYGRNCLRISFFEPAFNSPGDFFNLSNEQVQNAYRGFLVVRPLAKCIGRNAIDIKAKCTPVCNAKIRKAKISATCLGIKLTVDAFPHASQDEEFMTCAETTVWSMMEYYGNKYPIHNPVLPTDILSSIKWSSYERQVPSNGLRLEQISLSLQRQGFGCMIYQKSNPRFKELFTCYVESGLPLAVVTEGSWGKHAVVCIGRPPIDRSKINKLSIGINNNYVFWNNNEQLFVINDDNRPCYQIDDFNSPTPYFPGGSSIANFIVPLHKKIYMPAEQAIDKSKFLIENDFKAPQGSYVRTFLTSSRTYRQYIKNNPDLSIDIKGSYLTTDLPKFIWVTEVTYTEADFLNKKVNALILLDATGITTEGDVYSSLILKQNAGVLTIFDRKNRLFNNFSISTLPSAFQSFPGNLN